MKDSMLKKLGIGRKSLRTQLAEKDKEIQDLKKHLANARKDNTALTIENRNLRIESAEMRAAYYSVKEILQKRADAKAAQAGQTDQTSQTPQTAQGAQTARNTASAVDAANTVAAPESFLDENTEAAQAAITGIVAAVEASVSVIS